MLQPKKQKFKKQFRRGARVISEKGANIVFGDFGLKAVTRGRLSEKQLEAARRAISFFTRKEGKIWVRVFPDKPVTQKAAGTRMGSGKGDVVGFVVPVTPGKIIFEVSGIPLEAAREALRRAGYRIPFKTRFVAKNV
ncbi:MAG: 50S ribosomal protein L16 [Patescibacteria group bacterium]